MVESVNISDLVLDKAIYPRNDISFSTVANLQDAILAKAELPPIVICNDTLKVIDGWHRLEAFRRLGYTQVKAEVRYYDNDQDRFSDAVKENAQHGRPLDSYDRRRCVLRLMEFGMPKQEIAVLLSTTVERIEKYAVQIVETRNGEQAQLKSSMLHLSGRVVNESQLRVIEQVNGSTPTRLVKDLCRMLEHDLIHPTQGFVDAMDLLTLIWERKRQGFWDRLS